MQRMWVQRKVWEEKLRVECLTEKSVMSAMHVSTKWGDRREVTFIASKEKES